jgi:hypothetical protein
MIRKLKILWRLAGIMDELHVIYTCETDTGDITMKAGKRPKPSVISRRMAEYRD